jgi:hypothetical protein
MATPRCAMPPVAPSNSSSADNQPSTVAALPPAKWTKKAAKRRCEAELLCECHEGTDLQLSPISYTNNLLALTSPMPASPAPHLPLSIECSDITTPQAPAPVFSPPPALALCRHQCRPSWSNRLHLPQRGCYSPHQPQRHRLQHH